MFRPKDPPRTRAGARHDGVLAAGGEAGRVGVTDPGSGPAMTELLSGLRLDELLRE